MINNKDLEIKKSICQLQVDVVLVMGTWLMSREIDTAWKQPIEL